MTMKIAMEMEFEKEIKEQDFTIWDYIGALCEAVVEVC